MAGDVNTSSCEPVDSWEDWRPRARPKVDFSVAEIGADEVAVLDVTKLQYHLMTKSSYLTWMLCDGTHSAQDITHIRNANNKPLSLTQSIEAELLELSNAELLERQICLSSESATRRRLLKAAAASVTGGLALPVIRSISVPEAVSAASNVQPSSQCVPGDTCADGPTTSGSFGPYCCAFSAESGFRCIPVNQTGTGSCTPGASICGNWGQCQ